MYLAVLSILGLGRGIGDLASIENDPLGLTLEEERLPQRIRKRKNEFCPRTRSS
jgi:hypothetical protein